MEAVGQAAHPGAEAGHDDRISRRDQPFGRRRLEQDGNGTGRARLLDEVQSVRAAALAFDGEERIAGAQLARVLRKPADMQAAVSAPSAVPAVSRGAAP